MRVYVTDFLRFRVGGFDMNVRTGWKDGQERILTRFLLHALHIHLDLNQFAHRTPSLSSGHLQRSAGRLWIRLGFYEWLFGLVDRWIRWLIATMRVVLKSGWKDG